MAALIIKTPRLFVEDSIDSGCDVGEYDGRRLTATPAQVAELRDRAKHYADDGTDCGWPGLIASARATLRALEKAGL